MSIYQMEHNSFLVSSNHNPVQGSEFNHEPGNPPTIPTNPQSASENPSPDVDCLYNSETGDFSHAVFKFIRDVLFEEELEDRPCMLQDSLGLQAAEKSFHDVLGEKHLPLSDQLPHCLDQNVDSPDENFTSASSIGSCNSCFAHSNLAESNWIFGQVALESFPRQSFHVYSTPESNFLMPDLHCETQPFGPFNEAMGNGNMSISYSCAANSFQMRSSSTNAENNGSSNSLNQSRGRKKYEFTDHGNLEEGRRNKLSLVSSEESKQLEMIDNSFLQRIENNDAQPCPLFDELRNEASKNLQQNEKLQVSKLRTKKRVNNSEKVDLWTLLSQCAQAVGNSDQRTAYECLKQIKQHSSPFGNGHERMAHYFANGLEARLNGTGRLLYMLNSTSSADILRAYKLYVSVCPYRTMTNTLANRTIAKAAENATRLHVIDFGIYYGFQWPSFIHRLSTRPGGPPRIRITGIDHPQPGFRPAEKVEETGHRLKRVADALNVPFEYNAIAQKWETIRYEDLKINRDEVTVVNCMYRLKNLLDDTLTMDSPRDAVLKLIKKINPDIFLHGIINGSFNGPFFVTRFREALFHYSAIFDMFDTTVPREDQDRLVFEREMIGNDAINVIACEGRDRVERPQTYKQWQIRNCRIGFRQLPMHLDIVKRVREIKSEYHKNFSVEEDGHWVLLGWKGRTIHAISVWKPVNKT